MDPSDIVRWNHDIHLHTIQFSDGWHDFEDVAVHALRWTESERWAGVSEHTPIDPHHGPLHNPEKWRAECERQTAQYRNVAEKWRRMAQSDLDIRLLVGIEADMAPDRPFVSKATLARFDYVLMACHGGKFRNAGEADTFLRRLIGHPFADVLAHPDGFLGPFDPRECAWSKLFRLMAENSVACEYNLTKPLHRDILAIALDTPGLSFVIATDTHDFRNLGVKRLMDAWSESEGGGFDDALEYLFSLPQSPGSGNDMEKYLPLVDTPEKLRSLETRVYQRRRKIDPVIESLDPLENEFLTQLSWFEDDAPDRVFLIRRLNRFRELPQERLAGLKSCEEFRSFILDGRERRRRMPRAGS